MFFQKPKIGQGYKRREKAHHKRAGMIEFVDEIDDTHVQMSNTFLAIELSDFWKKFKQVSDNEVRQFKIEESENKIRFIKEQISIQLEKLKLEVIERARL